MERAIIENMEKALINELSQGKELAEQLMNRLKQSSSQEKRDFLVGQILSSYEKALSMLNQTNPKTSALESPLSFGDTSPRSVSFDQENTTPVNVSKRRKTMPRWTKQIKVCLGTGVEGPLEDGYSWRKYGQKDILGSSHPRGYYRCTYRHSQGCLATKQVQRSDRDSSLIEVTYRGRHTCCTRSSQQPIASASLSQQESANFIQLEDREKNPTQSQSTLLNLKGSLEVKTEDLDTMEGNIVLPFPFSSSPIESETVDNLFLSEAITESSFGAEFSMPFLSPTTSESNYLSDLTEIISLPTSVTNSPVGSNYCLDFTIDKLDFGLNFPFDSLEFFS